MTQKKLQKNSKLNPMDRNSDGIVDDHEIEVAQVEHDLRKQRAQRRMATASLIAMALFTGAMFFVDLERVIFSILLVVVSLLHTWVLQLL